jgi:predicted nucleic acid-binding protein
MKVVVDTNIVFSALLNSNGIIGEILFNSPQSIEFYSCNYMRYEIHKHWEKLKKISGLSDDRLRISYTYLLDKLRFINEEIIPAEVWNSAEELVKNIDIDDIDFVALTQFLNAVLWTGDKVLYNSLKQIEFQNIVNTAELNSLRAL